MPNDEYAKLQEVLIERPERDVHGCVITVPSVASRQKLTGLSLAQIPELLGVSARTLQEWEQGHRALSGARRTMLLIAQKNAKALVDMA